jgi:hypothetical protein
MFRLNSLKAVTGLNLKIGAAMTKQSSSQRGKIELRRANASYLVKTRPRSTQSGIPRLLQRSCHFPTAPCPSIKLIAISLFSTSSHSSSTSMVKPPFLHKDKVPFLSRNFSILALGRCCDLLIFLDYSEALNPLLWRKIRKGFPIKI